MNYQLITHERFRSFGIETIGRRWSMVGGGFFMGVLFWIVGAIGVSMDPTDPDTPGGAKKAMAASEWYSRSSHSRSSH